MRRPVSASSRLVRDEEWGYRRTATTPDQGEVIRFYESHYADLLRAGGRAPDLARLMLPDGGALEERRWLEATLFRDILYALESARATDVAGSMLDVGAGTGDFVEFMSMMGWAARGVEPASEVVELAHALGRDVREGVLESMVGNTYDVLSLLNVLEHVPDPAAQVRLAYDVIRPHGHIVVRVPNDFSVLQHAAETAIGKSEWWVVIPDHLNYFDLESMERLLAGNGFLPVYHQGDFPMELFLLMGEDYIGRTDVGQRCHERRRRLELAMPSETRRAWYQDMIERGLGRNLLVVAERLDS